MEHKENSISGELTETAKEFNLLTEEVGKKLGCACKSNDGFGILTNIQMLLIDMGKRLKGLEKSPAGITYSGTISCTCPSIEKETIGIVDNYLNQLKK